MPCSYEPESARPGDAPVRLDDPAPLSRAHAPAGVYSDAAPCIGEGVTVAYPSRAAEGSRQRLSREAWFLSTTGVAGAVRAPGGGGRGAEPAADSVGRGRSGAGTAGD